MAPVINILKTRMKSLLHEKILYTDGMTPDELNHKLNNLTNIKYFYENDLE